MVTRLRPLLCAAWTCAVVGFHLPVPRGGPFSPELRAAWRQLLQVAVTDANRAVETASAKGWFPERPPHPKDDRANLETLVGLPDEPHLRRSEQLREVVAAETRMYGLLRRAQELSDQGEHRAALETLRQARTAFKAHTAACAPFAAEHYASLPPAVAERFRNGDEQVEQLWDEYDALREQGRYQAADEVWQRTMQLADQLIEERRQEYERRGDHGALLGMRDAAAGVPTGTHARLERRYQSPADRYWPLRMP